ncbi:MAG: UDP-3-O-(3-hydroxymyristoyl)glucosamine N-acyltransferase [Pseudomonadota bacterium]
MEHPGFFKKAGPFSLREVASAAEIALSTNLDEQKLFHDIKTLQSASQDHLSFLDNVKYIPQCQTTSAGGIFIAQKFTEYCPDTAIPLVAQTPYHCFAKILSLFYPEALHCKMAGSEGYEPGQLIHPSAELEEGVTIEPGVVIGPEVKIGSGTHIAAGAVIGYRVHIGRGCYIGSHVAVAHTLIGNNVILHAGVKAGQDGFGFAINPTGHLKVPQIGRVIIQDCVEIGANTTIDRGALEDTIIGEGTKIDNLVQIAHNVVIGQNCLMVAQSGISGSAELGNFVVVAGKAGIVGHLKVGDGAQLGGGSGLTMDVQPGERWMGYPAKPFRQWVREIKTLEKISERKSQK